VLLYSGLTFGERFFPSASSAERQKVDSQLVVLGTLKPRNLRKLMEGGKKKEFARRLCVHPVGREKKKPDLMSKSEGKNRIGGGEKNSRAGETPLSHCKIKGQEK